MTMAEPRGVGTSVRVLVSVLAVATTVGGSLVMAVHDEPEASAVTQGNASLASPWLEPLPTLEPTTVLTAAPSRRPAPITTTRSSR
jgi:hypothetical protein